MAYLGRPDLPAPRKRKKPRAPRSTLGNVQTPTRPRVKNPNIVGRYKSRPKVGPNLIVKKRGGGLGYVTVRKPGGAAGGGAPGAAGAPGAPAPPVDPYDAYDSYKQIKRDEESHTGYVTGQVAPWLSGALTNLTGVDPARPGINTTAQQQYLANVQGIVGGALGQSANATPMNPAATTPGGIVASPTAYLSEAASQGASGRASAMIGQAQVQSALNTMQPNTQAQGYVYALADYAKGLPQVYAERRAQARVKIDEFIAETQAAAAESAERERHNRVTEAISATNAQTNAAIQLGRLGLSAADQATDNAPDPTVGAPAPYGYVRDVDGSLRRDPSVPAASSATGGGGTGNKPLSPSAISSMQGKWKRPKSSPPKLGPGWKQPVWDPGTKAWYAKRAPGSGSGTGTKPAKAMGYGSLVSDIGKKWNGSGSGPFGSGTPGWAETFRGDPAGVADALSDWTIENRASFNTAGGKFDPDKLLRVLATLGDGRKKYALVWAKLKPRIKNGVLT